MASRSLKNRAHTKKKHWYTAPLFICGLFAILIAFGSVAAFATANSWLKDLPDYTDADAFNTALPTEMYASDGTTLLARFQLEWREPVEADEISQYVYDATVDTEDIRFYEHKGFDVQGIARAVVVNVLGGSREGASTITQQFVRNTILSGEMDEISIKRKIREIYLALKLEQIYSKDEILLMYLNTINYGSGAYGIEAAAQRYFSKHASELDLVESATLVGIPQSPTNNNPIDNPETCVARRNVVLARMLSAGDITQEQYEEAVNTPLTLNPTTNPENGIYEYPYFTSYARNYLTDDSGPYKYSTSELFKGGLKIITTLDVNAQECAEDAAETKRNAVGDSYEVALAAVDPANGHVKALVGGSDYEESQVNIATGEGSSGRQCGSAFKTFTLVSSIEQNIDPNNTYVDCSSPATIDGYKLENYGNTNYGTRTIARAFAVSSNTGFVRLISSIGVSTVIDTAERMGITSNLRSSGAGASLTLGVANVTMLEMANAYSTLANGGTRHTVSPILKIYDSKGNTIVDNSNPSGTRAVSAEASAAAIDVMKLVVNSSEGTGTDAALPNGQTVAGKTGTSENYMDITFVGCTPYIAVGIWVGDPSNVKACSSSLSCGDVFRNFVSSAYGDHAVVEFPTASSPNYKTYNDSKYGISSSYSGSSSSSSNSYSYNYSNSDSSNSNSYNNSDYSQDYYYEDTQTQNTESQTYTQGTGG